MAKAPDGLDLLYLLRQGHRQGQAAIGGKAVAFIGPQVLRLVQQGLRGQDAAQFLEQALFDWRGYVVAAFGAVVVKMHKFCFDLIWIFP